MTDLQALSIMHDLERWSDIRKLLERPGKITGADFEPDPAILEFLHNDARVLVVGSGGSPVFSSNAMYQVMFQQPTDVNIPMLMMEGLICRWSWL